MSYVFDSEMAAGLMTSMLAWTPSALFGFVGYVLTALGLYTLAQRRGINNPWLAWVPVVNVWLIGSLSDQYQYVVRGQYRSKRKALLVLGIASFALTVAVVAMGVSLLANLVFSAMGNVSDAALVEMFMGPALGIMGLGLALAGVGIAFAILYFMALYDVYRSMDPSNSVAFLVLSILFSVTAPFFLFFGRNKDLGMPPRRQERPYETPRQDRPTWDEPRDYL